MGCCSCVWGRGTSLPAGDTSWARRGRCRWSGLTPPWSPLRSSPTGGRSPSLEIWGNLGYFIISASHHWQWWLAASAGCSRPSASWSGRSAPGWSAPRPCAGTHRGSRPPTAELQLFPWPVWVCQCGTTLKRPKGRPESGFVWGEQYQGLLLTWLRSELKLTVLILLWTNCRMFQGRSLCLEEEEERF